jgi:tetratricopeptide (TPR) repeat protein
MATESTLRALGLSVSVVYAGLIVWLYAAQPQTVAQVTGGLAAGIGAYHIDQRAFDDGLTFFQRDQFEEARAAFARADSAQRDARTQFYIAYSYYRQGWGRVYCDDVLFTEGLRSVERAIALAPDGRLVVDDPQLGLRSADELRAELRRGLVRDASDLNPLRLFRSRQ